MFELFATLPDTAMLSRIQFAFTVSYHIMFPTITIGLSLYLAFMEGMWLKTQNLVYLQQVKFWMKPFAITFGMGVVSGVVLSYEFGTNFVWLESGFTQDSLYGDVHCCAGYGEFIVLDFGG